MNETSWGPRIRPALLVGAIAIIATIALALSL